MAELMLLQLLQIWGSIYRCKWLVGRRSEAFRRPVGAVLAYGREAVGRWPTGPRRSFGG
jgi:hypothetical protein